jgi:small subunit ribosomal protein S2
MSDQKTIMREMLANAVHFGHRTSKWNPKMAPYLHGKRNGVHIIDLNKSYEGLQKATAYLTDAAGKGKTILLVSTKQQSIPILKEAADKCQMPYVTSKWIPGLLTNFKTIRARVKYMLKLKDELMSGGFDKYTKKEAGKLRKEIDKLEIALGGVANLERKPDVVFILDVSRDNIAIKEAKTIGATVVAVADSNVNPQGIDYLIPGNDDAIKSIKFLVGAISDAIELGKRKVKS